MDKQNMQDRLGQYFSFLKQRIQEAQTIKLPLELVPLEKACNYMVVREKERCYRQAEEELRRLFPEIDLYERMEDIRL